MTLFSLQIFQVKEARPYQLNPTAVSVFILTKIARKKSDGFQEKKKCTNYVEILSVGIVGCEET